MSVSVVACLWSKPQISDLESLKRHETSHNVTITDYWDQINLHQKHRRKRVYLKFLRFVFQIGAFSSMFLMPFTFELIKTQVSKSDHFGWIPRGIISQRRKVRRNPIELKSTSDPGNPTSLELNRNRHPVEWFVLLISTVSKQFRKPSDRFY